MFEGTPRLCSRISVRGILPSDCGWIAIDPAKFCEKFGSYRHSVLKVIQVHDYFAANPSALPRHRPLPQPPEDGRIGPYRVLRKIGEGGLANVYLAEDVHADRQIVLKLSHHGFEEASILGPLEASDTQQIISRVLFLEPLGGGGSALGMPFVGLATLQNVLDYVYRKGASRPISSEALLEATRSKIKTGDRAPGNLRLHDEIAGRSWESAIVNLGRRLAQGLAFLHENRVHHRDLKPSNVLLRWDGRPIILDFNLAEDLWDDEPQTGGTLLYMAPEQIQSSLALVEPKGLLDDRADLYSLGVILYQLLTGVHPFDLSRNSRSEHEAFDVVVNRLLGLQRTGARSLLELRPDLNPRLARLVDRMLAFDPAMRPRSAKEIAEQFQTIATLASPRRWSGLQRVVTVLAASVTIVLFAGAVSRMQGVGDGTKSLSAYVASEEQPQVTDPEETLNALLRRNPRDADALSQRGERRMRAGELGSALLDFESAKRIRPDGRASLLLAQCLMLAGKLDDAITEADRAEDLGERSAALYCTRAWCKYQWIGIPNPTKQQILERFDSVKRDAAAAKSVDSKCGAASYIFALACLAQYDNSQKWEYQIAADAAMKIAIEQCRPGGTLYRNACYIFALNPNPTREQEEDLWRCLKLAAEHRVDVAQMIKFERFDRVRTDPRIEQILRIQGTTAGATRPHLPDPLLDSRPSS